MFFLDCLVPESLEHVGAHRGGGFVCFFAVGLVVCEERERASVIERDLEGRHARAQERGLRQGRARVRAQHLDHVGRRGDDVPVGIAGAHRDRERHPRGLGGGRSGLSGGAARRGGLARKEHLEPREGAGERRGDRQGRAGDRERHGTAQQSNDSAHHVTSRMEAIACRTAGDGPSSPAWAASSRPRPKRGDDLWSAQREQRGVAWQGACRRIVRKAAREG